MASFTAESQPFGPHPEHLPYTHDHATSSGIQDVLPIPSTAPTSGLDIPESQPESLSHALTHQSNCHDLPGAAQVHHDRVVDLGWNDSKEAITEQLVSGISNVELWKLIRRFDQQIYHVKETTSGLPGGLDMNFAFISQDEQSLDKINFRANAERLYLTILVGLLAAVKHIQRLRSWRETRRTSAFAAAYFIAWTFDLVGLLLSVSLFALIVHPPFRTVLFPPAPLAIVDASTGGLRSPRAGVLGSTDSATGAPEHLGGEAVEQEASNFVTGLISVVISGIGGAHADAGPHETQEDNAKPGASSVAAPDPTALAKTMADAKNAAAGGKEQMQNDKTKVPMETVIWSKAKPVMHGLAYACDTWERLGNALSPTPPFPPQTHQLRLAALVLPLVVISAFNSYWTIKFATFLMGFAFFGKPVYPHAAAILDSRYPHWRQLLDLRFSLFRGVPTNAQLALTLLRTAEAANAPLPPPPKGKGELPEEAIDVSDNHHLDAAEGDIPLGADEIELIETAARDEDVLRKAEGDQIRDSDGAEHGRKTSKFLRIFKEFTKHTAKTAIAMESARAKVTTSRAARDHRGVAENPAKRQHRVSGPVAFQARENGRRGRAYIWMSEVKEGGPANPWLVFSTAEAIGENGMAVQEEGDNKEVWRIRLADIVELRKESGYSWKAKLVVGWSMGREIAGGLEIKTRQGATYILTALPLRDALFDRLVAVGDQRWEAW